MKLYGCYEIEKLFDAYDKVNGSIFEIQEGTLGYGISVCIAAGFRSCVIKEVYVNAWTSGHKIRFYNVLPKKYQDSINENNKLQILKAVNR